MVPLLSANKIVEERVLGDLDCGGALWVSGIIWGVLEQQRARWLATGSTGLRDLPGNGLPVFQGSLPSLRSREERKYVREDE